MPRGGKKQVVVQRQSRINDIHNRINDEEIGERVMSMFGKLTRVDPEILEKKRSLLSRYLSALASDLQKIVTAAVKAYDGDIPETLENTVVWAGFIKERDKFIAKHPHEWVADNFLDELHKLKVCMNEVNASTSGSIAAKEIEWFLKWENSSKYILPSTTEQFNFAEVPSIMSDIFPLLGRLDFVASNVIKEIVHPSYDWEAALDEKIAKMARKLGGSTGAAIVDMKSTFASQLPSVYLKKLGVASRGINWGDIMERVMTIEDSKKRRIAMETEEMLTGTRNPEIRQVAEDVFGKKNIEAILQQAHDDVEEE